MPVHDRTGEPIEPLTKEEALARIRADLCPGAETCKWDHEHTDRDDTRPVETVDVKEHL